MGSHPINLALRFLLEVAALLAIGYWGWSTSAGVLRFHSVSPSFIDFAVPYTRRVVLFILPLGKGVDDVIALIAGLVVLVIFGGGWARDLARDTRRYLAE